MRDLSAEVSSLLLVHAHPDDETITTGATMAGLAAAGVPVTLVTCTRGELGEVIGDELAHLAGDGDALAAHRETELAAAMSALGVRDHRFLGAADGVRYRDSGMVWGPDGLATVPPDVAPDAFAVADLEVAAARLAAIIDEVRPSHVVTYEPGGGYGHPDHVRASAVTARAVQLAEHLTHPLWVVVPESVDQAALTEVANAGLAHRESSARPSQVVPDTEVDYWFVGDDTIHTRKAAGLRAHATQVIVSPDEGFFALSNLIWQPLLPAEFFQIARR